MVDKNSPVLIACRPTGIIAILLCFCVAILLSNNASAANLVLNPGFETGDMSNWSNSFFTTSDIESNTGVYSAYDSQVFASGGSITSYYTRYISQSVNLTNVDYISFYYKHNTVKNDWPGSHTSYVYCDINADGSLEWTDSNVGAFYKYCSIDVSDVTGVTNIKLGGYFLLTAASITIHYSFDDISTDASAASPEFDDVSWDQDLYYTGETANIITKILSFDDATYSYYLDLYNTNDYLTTFELTSETESNYYTFPLDWADTSLVAKLVRVTDPYAINEVELAYDVSLFESLYWDTTVAFNKSSYIPSESLLVTWSGAANGSSVWLQAGDDGEVLVSNVSYSGSFTFDVPANTTETYYWVDVVTDGYSQAFAICDISPIPDFFFNYTVSTNLDEYSPGDIVTVTYSSDKICGIRVIKTISDNTYHSVSSLSGGYNKTWQFYISEDEPFGFYDVYLVDISGIILDDVRYSLLPSTSSLEILQLSINLHEEFAIFAQTVNVSFLTIEDPDGVEVWNESVDALMYKYVYYTPTTKYGIYTAYLYDDSTLSDTIMVYYAEAPEGPVFDDPVIDDPVIDDDVLEDDETMTEYYNEKFRDFAPTIWGFFMLMCLLFLMSILTSFNSGGKR
jgi:hypothetical protein